jgi:MinD superfamily P-loop ATPase
LELITDAYSDKLPVNTSDVKSFRQIHCSKGHLIHKGQVIKPEMAEHVFPEIKQNNFHKCNICDHNCEFNFLDKQIKAQEDLVKPKSSKDVIDTK